MIGRAAIIIMVLSLLFGMWLHSVHNERITDSKEASNDTMYEYESSSGSYVGCL